MPAPVAEPTPAASALSEAGRRATMKWSAWEGTAYAVMVKFGNEFLTPFALLLGAGTQHVGLLTSIPVLLAAVAQKAGARLLDVFSDRRRVLSAFTALQALVWLPLLSLPFASFLSGEARVWLLIFLACALYVLEGILHPAWASLMSDVVPENERGRYFAHRNALAGFVGFLSLPAAGWLLGWFSGESAALGFALIFGVAALARAASSRLFARHANPPLAREGAPEAGNVLSVFRNPRTRAFATYVTATGFVVSLASPFFAVYMLRELGFDYLTFSVLVAANVLAHLLAWPYWGKLVDRYGSRRVMVACAALIPVVPLLWLTSQEAAFILLFQAFAGFAWSGLTLAEFNYTLDVTGAGERAHVLANRNLFAGIGTFFGAAAGGFLAANGVALFGFSGIPFLFLASGVLRFAAAAAFLPGVPRVRERGRLGDRAFLFKAVAEYPTRGLGSEFGFVVRVARHAEREAENRVRRARRVVVRVAASVLSPRLAVRLASLVASPHELSDEVLARLEKLARRAGRVTEAQVHHALRPNHGTRGRARKG